MDFKRVVSDKWSDSKRSGQEPVKTQAFTILKHVEQQ
jgi:hypothetical protein